MNRSSATLTARRDRLLGENTPLFYDDPVHIVRGEDVWLYDAEGKRYLDCYNNVPHVGHCHPHVVEAIHQQASTLNTHTRYLRMAISTTWYMHWIVWLDTIIPKNSLNTQYSFMTCLVCQPRWTDQIANSINDVLQPIGVGVVIEAQHQCMTTRGVNKPGVAMVTSCMLGAFREDPATRSEFLNAIPAK